jgi:hypothetical protein
VDAFDVWGELEIVPTKDRFEEIIRQRCLHPNGVDLDHAVLHRDAGECALDRNFVAFEHPVITREFDFVFIRHGSQASRRLAREAEPFAEGATSCRKRRHRLRQRLDHSTGMKAL